MAEINIINEKRKNQYFRYRKSEGKKKSNRQLNKSKGRKMMKEKQTCCKNIEAEERLNFQRFSVMWGFGSHHKVRKQRWNRTSRWRGAWAARALGPSVSRRILFVNSQSHRLSLHWRMPHVSSTRCWLCASSSSSRFHYIDKSSDFDSIITTTTG